MFPGRPRGHGRIKETMNLMVRGASMVKNTSGGGCPWPMVLVENATMEVSSLILIKINIF